MRATLKRKGVATLAAFLLLATAGVASAQLALPAEGIAVLGAGSLSAPGTRTFSLQVGSGFLNTPDGGLIYFWGYGDALDPARIDATTGQAIPQIPGPTLIVTEGETVTVNLTNPPGTGIDQAVSMVFPGIGGVAATGGTPGLLTAEAAVGGTVSYSFTAPGPGTYVYHSGTNMSFQTEMGLTGTLIVRPADFDQLDPALRKAYGHPGTNYDHEYLLHMMEMDSAIHAQVEESINAALPSMTGVDMSSRDPNYWFLNGRAAPDTLFPPGVAYLKHQPYNCLPMMIDHQRILVRQVGGGRDFHPQHYHGNHLDMVGIDGQFLVDSTGATASIRMNTAEGHSGGAMDALFTWDGRDLNWDQHNGPTPTRLPEGLDLAYGGFWGGSPFLGQAGALPPGEGGLNPWSAYMHIWHSHHEKELANNGVFPGGILTFVVIGTAP